jgi:hypothetical protein
MGKALEKVQEEFRAGKNNTTRKIVHVFSRTNETKKGKRYLVI